MCEGGEREGGSTMNRTRIVDRVLKAGAIELFDCLRMQEPFPGFQKPSWHSSHLMPAYPSSHWH